MNDVPEWEDLPPGVQRRIAVILFTALGLGFMVGFGLGLVAGAIGA